MIDRLRRVLLANKRIIDAGPNKARLSKEGVGVEDRPNGPISKREW